MTERIHEIILVTRNHDGSPHIAPMGLRRRDELWLIAPFRPSRTLDNLQREGRASVNMTDDVRVFAGCLTGRRDWPVAPCEQTDISRLRDPISHRELIVERVEQDETRPRFFCRSVRDVTHRPYPGHNRAQAAVLELAILVSRLDRLPAAKVDAEIAYLQLAIDKTAGEHEHIAWDWLMSHIRKQRRKDCA